MIMVEAVLPRRGGLSSDVRSSAQQAGMKLPSAISIQTAASTFARTVHQPDPDDV